MSTWCPRALSTGVCDDWDCPDRHDVEPCRTCRTFFPHGHLKAHEQSADHLRIVQRHSHATPSIPPTPERPKANATGPKTNAKGGSQSDKASVTSQAGASRGPPPNGPGQQPNGEPETTRSATPDQPEPQPAPSVVYCHVCLIYLRAVVLRAHIASKEHQKHTERQAAGLPPPAPPPGSMHCPACNKDVPLSSFQTHLNSKAHITRQSLADAARSGQGNNAPKPEGQPGPSNKAAKEAEKSIRPGVEGSVVDTSRAGSLSSTSTAVEEPPTFGLDVFASARDSPRQGRLESAPGFIGRTNYEGTVSADVMQFQRLDIHEPATVPPLSHRSYQSTRSISPTPSKPPLARSSQGRQSEMPSPVPAPADVGATVYGPLISVSAERGFDFGAVLQADDGTFRPLMLLLEVENRLWANRLALAEIRLQTVPSESSEDASVAFSAQLHGSSVWIERGEPRLVEVSFAPPRPGRFEAILLLVFRDEHDEMEYKIPRSLRGAALASNRVRRQKTHPQNGLKDKEKYVGRG
ncbi:hypothetical protein OF83DRAFT_1170796 [Amylostereum chailletii]|nr:hypothetical protein OF83DRAFT_1170796 [Amylostereum chailletii]